MEHERNFDRMAYLRLIVNQFIHLKTLESVEEKYNQLISRREENPIKIKIIKDCKNIFSLPYARESIANAKSKGMPNTELASIVTKKLAAHVFGDNKRHYDMSAITSEEMVLTVPTYDSVDGLCIGPEDGLYDLDGNPMYIQRIGSLKYNSLQPGEYLYKFRVWKQINGVDTEPQEIFSNIDLNRLLEEKDYYYAVVGEILSSNNIDLSFAEGYVGEHSGTKGSSLKIGEEYFDKDSQKDKVYGYTYKISKDSAIVYDGEKIEAIRAYNKDQAKKKAAEQVNNNGTDR